MSTGGQGGVGASAPFLDGDGVPSFCPPRDLRDAPVGLTGQEARVGTAPARWVTLLVWSSFLDARHPSWELTCH